MADQIFHEHVAQVAGRDIHNYGVDELAALNPEQLKAALAHCKERLRDVRKRIFTSPAVTWFLAATMIIGAMVITGTAFSHSMLFGCVLLAGIALPLFFIMSVANKYGPMVSAYRDCITRIEFVLHSQGWE